MPNNTCPHWLILLPILFGSRVGRSCYRLSYYEEQYYCYVWLIWWTCWSPGKQNRDRYIWKRMLRWGGGDAETTFFRRRVQVTMGKYEPGLYCDLQTWMKNVWSILFIAPWGGMNCMNIDRETCLLLYIICPSAPIQYYYWTENIEPLSSESILNRRRYSNHYMSLNITI